MRYTYRDFVTKKERYTRGEFAGYTQPTGLLNARYAKFKRPHGYLFVPSYLLTAESKSMLPEVTEDNGAWINQKEES